MDRREKGVRWGLVFALALLGLIRPLLSMAGVYEAGGGGGPSGPVLVTALVAVLWVGIVVGTRAPNPPATLALAGASYGAFAVLLQQLIWNLLLGGAPEGAPSSGPVLVLSWASILVTNTIWGAFLGLLAAGMRRLLKRRRPLRQRSGR